MKVQSQTDISLRGGKYPFIKRIKNYSSNSDDSEFFLVMRR